MDKSADYIRSAKSNLQEKRITKDFFIRDVLEVAPEMIGKYLVVSNSENFLKKYVITEVEAYKGPEDLACHASKGRTSRTDIMFHLGGYVYVYFIYGMYWMLNIVTGGADEPQAVLIRGIEGCNGPGKLTRLLKIDRSYYGEDLTSSPRIWIEDSGLKPEYVTRPRIGINYAGDYWKDLPWRYLMISPQASSGSSLLAGSRQ